MRKVVTGIALLLAGVACGTNDPSISLREPAQAPVASQALCSTIGMDSARAYGRVDRLSGAFDATAGQIAEWQETRTGPNGPRVESAFRAKPTDLFVAVCYYDGEYTGIPAGPPQPVGDIVPGQEVQVQPKQPYTRISLLLLRDGVSTLDRAGRQDNLPVAAPN